MTNKINLYFNKEGKKIDELVNELLYILIKENGN